MRRTLCLLVLVAGPAGAGNALAFADAAADAGVAAEGSKYAGAAFGDLAGDGCYALAVNRNGGPLSLYRSDCGTPPKYTDVTAQLAPQLGSQERSLVWGDLNNDGLADLMRTGSAVVGNNGIEISLSHGWDVPLGNGGASNEEIVRSNGAILNIEGVGVVDFDADGWLDLMAQTNGMRIWRNPADGGTTMEEATTIADSLGLPLADINGDYTAVADYDDDGDVDLLSRNMTVPVLWENQGGRFVANASFTNRSEDGSNNDKGGASFCDFDSDGLLDIFWTSPATIVSDAVWRQDPVGTFTPQAPLVGLIGNAEGVTCGDVDHDGDPDLLLTTLDGEQLFLNATVSGGTVQFHPFPQRFSLGQTWSAVLLDEDHDGDLDIYVNKDGPNALWRNGLDDARAVEIRARRALPGGLRRDDLGATVRLETCAGELASGVQAVSGGNGRGAQDSPRLHFGLGGQSSAVLVARVRFVGGQVVRRAFRTDVLRPGTVIDVVSDAPDDLAICSTGQYPVGCACSTGGGEARAPAWLAAGLLACLCARRRLHPRPPARGCGPGG